MNPAPYDRLEKLFHEPKRLAIVSSLCAETSGLSFRELRDRCECTDGNLSRHLKALESAGIVRQLKEPSSEGRRSTTTVHLSESGRSGFVAYLYQLEEVLYRSLNALSESESRDLAEHPLSALLRRRSSET